MAYDIEYDSKAFKQLQKLNPSIAKELLDTIEEFAATPVLTKIKKIKTPFDGAYRLIIGDYRVIFIKKTILCSSPKLCTANKFTSKYFKRKNRCLIFYNA